MSSIREQICHQIDLYHFCSAIETFVRDQENCISWQLFVRDSSNQWQQIQHDDSSVLHQEMSFQPIKDDGLSSFMTGLQCDSKLVQKEDGFAFYCGFRAEEQNHAVFVLMGFQPFVIEEKSAQMLSLLLSTAWQKAFFHQALMLEKDHHANTTTHWKAEIESQQGLLKQLQKLHRISIRLWHAKTFDNMLHKAVYQCIRDLDIDRMAIFLGNYQTGLMRGTYGTDSEGRVTNEHWYCTAIDDHHQAKMTLEKGKHITLDTDVPLYHDNKIIGKGWNATISLWDGDEIIGWIACDNLLTASPLKSYHSELLKLLGVTLSQHLIQRRAQDQLHALNISLEQRILERTAQLEAANKQLQELSRKDSLTNVANRRMLEEKSSEEWRRAVRYQYPISLLMIDVDHFKQYNDRYGHGLGDECLKKVAKALSKIERRAGALLARYGGEEFVYLLPNCDREMAVTIAERALNGIQELRIAHDASQTHCFVSISIGGKSLIPRKIDRYEEFLKEADIALYEAKSAGRNQAFVL